MRICMFHPVDHPLQRGWVGRIDGEHVIQLAAQTLQAFFTGGASAREHAVYPLDEVCMLSPVLHPPAVRIFENEASFEFGNPAAITGPDAEIRAHGASNRLLQGQLTLTPRIAAVVGAGGAIGGFTVCADWRRPGAPPPKDRDFALGLGPAVVTPDELDVEVLEAVVLVDGDEQLRGRPAAFDWELGRAFAAEGTVLYPGDVLVGPAAGQIDRIDPGRAVTLEVEGIGSLLQRVASDA
jgi:hypothetical protein